MEAQRLYAIVSAWVQTGAIADADKLALRALYLEQIGAVPGCTECPDFYSDVQRHFRFQLKQTGTPVKNSSRKYLIAEGQYLRLPGEQITYKNEGEETDSVKLLTDKVAESVLQKYPEFAGVYIVENPEYEAPAPAAKKSRKKAEASTEPSGTDDLSFVEEDENDDADNGIEEGETETK